ncbi:MAG: nucleotidyltransferase family protein [candidate division KSB1 bacterium]
MKAMIFAAGLGTRLRPLTNTRPKALIEINGITLLERAIQHLRSAGVNEIMVNAHHFAPQIAAFLRARNNLGLRVELSHEEVLLDTGGGLKKAAWFFDDGQPFFVHNADVLSHLDLARMYRFHVAHHALATLAVKPRATKRQLVFDEAGRLCGRKEALTAGSPAISKNTHLQGGIVESPIEEGSLDLAFDGIHVISPALLGMLEEEGAFSIIDTYLRLAAAGERILAFRSDEYYWRDVGKLAELEEIAKELAEQDNVLPLPLKSVLQ